MDGLTPGRMVHYVVAGGDYVAAGAGVHRAAVVTRVLHQDRTGGVPSEAVSLYVFCDPAHDGQKEITRSEVPYDKNGAPGTWHWIEKA